MSDGATAWVTPDSPPIVNSTTRPIANSIAVVKRSLPPHIVSVQLTIFTPVGMAMAIVATENTATETGPRPEANMWWAHTPQPRNPIAAPGEHDERVAEQRLAGEHRQHLGHDAEATAG